MRSYLAQSAASAGSMFAALGISIANIKEGLQILALMVGIVGSLVPLVLALKKRKDDK